MSKRLRHGSERRASARGRWIFRFDFNQFNSPIAWLICFLPKTVAVAIWQTVHSVLNGRSGMRGSRPTKKPRSAMSDTDDLPKPERVPFFQRVLDNPFLLLFLGIVMPTVFYILWGVMEIATLPIAP
jgi:hypothetical protein